jgi:prepilin-type N-terminal cleavage/methylation domain-containing protein
MRTRRGGFTLIELMVVVAIMGIISIFVGRVLTFNEHAYQSTDQLTQAQQDLRAVNDLLERDLRHAGMLVPDDVAICGIDAVNGPDTLYVSDALAIDPQDDFSTYAGITVTSGDASASPSTLDLSSLIVEPSPPSRPAYDTNGDGTNDSDFQVGGGVILVSTDSPEKGVACGRVTAVNVGGTAITVAFDALLTTATTNMIAVPAHEYRVVGNQLLWDGNVVANDIEDLQVVYIIDNDNDNQVDVPQEIFGDDETTANDLFKSNSPSYGGGTINIAAGTSAAALVREVQVSLVARTRLEDKEYTSGVPQARGNRDLSGATADGYRRRVITTKVMLRNVHIEI